MSAQAMLDLDFGQPAECAPPPYGSVDWCVWQAMHNVSGAEERWAARRRTGLSDRDLAAALGYEFGIQGGFSSPRGENGGYDAWYRGMKSPRVNITRASDLPEGRTIDLRGGALLKAARRLLDIGTESTP